MKSLRQPPTRSAKSERKGSAYRKYGEYGFQWNFSNLCNFSEFEMINGKLKNISKIFHVSRSDIWVLIFFNLVKSKLIVVNEWMNETMYHFHAQLSLIKKQRSRIHSDKKKKNWIKNKADRWIFQKFAWFEVHRGYKKIFSNFSHFKNHTRCLQKYLQ